MQYRFPSHVELSDECKDLIQRIFVVDTSRRLNIAGIKAHPWFQRNLPAELQQAVQNDGRLRSRYGTSTSSCASSTRRRGGRGRGFGGVAGGGGSDFYPDEDDEMMDGSGQFSGDYAQYD